MITTLVYDTFCIGDVYTARDLRQKLNNLYERSLIDRAAR